MATGSLSRRIRRGSIPAPYVGLLSFSLVLFGIGVVAYVASLPTLIQASSDSSATSPVHVVAAALLGIDPTEEDRGDAGPGAKGEDAKGDAGKDEDAKAGESGHGLTFGGAVMQSINVAKPPAKGGSGESQDAGNSSGGSGSSSSGSSSGGQSSGNSSGGSSSGSSGSNGGGSAPQTPPVSEEEENRVYNSLLSEAQKIPGYVNEINAATQSFNNDLYADEATRAQRYREIDSLMWRLYGEYDTVVNGILVPNESRYKDEQGELISMYRLLTEYASILREAWKRNQGSIDTAANLDYIMAPIRQNESNGSNSQLQEFNRIYGGFSL